MLGLLDSILIVSQSFNLQIIQFNRVNALINSAAEPCQQRSIRGTCGWIGGDEAQRLLTMVNSPTGESFGSILFLPPFGMSTHQLFTPAFFMASAGFRAVRFDGRNNVGASPGEILDYRLGILLEDARVAADRLLKSTGSENFLIVGSSISASVALKLAREYPLSRAVLMVPVIDIQSTVEQAADASEARRTDRVGEGKGGKIREIFGYHVRAPEFYEDLWGTGLGSSQEVITLARSLRGRVELILAEKDEYMSSGIRDDLVEAIEPAEATVLAQTGHNFQGSPATIKRAFSRLVEIANEHFDVPQAQRSTALPTSPALVEAAKQERAALHHFLAGQVRNGTA